MSKPIIVVDLETTSLEERKGKIHGLAVVKEDAGEYFPSWNVPHSVRRDLADPSIAKVAHNARFDLRFLVAHGFKVDGPIYDTMLMAQLIDDNSPLSLKVLAERYLGGDSLRNKRELDRVIDEAGAKNIAGLCALDLFNPEHPYLDTIAEYCIEDATNTFKLFWLFKQKLQDLHDKCQKHLGLKETPLTYFLKETAPTEQMLLDVEVRGVHVDLQKIEEVRKDAVDLRDRIIVSMNELCADKIGEIEDELYQKALDKRKSPAGKAKVERSSDKYDTKFSWESNQHVGKLFYEKFKISPALVRKTEKGQYMVSETYLKFLQVALIAGHPLVEVLKMFAKFKKQCKIIGTYTGDSETGIMSHVGDKDGAAWIWPRYPQKTVTGRLSGQDPNMQNLQRGSPVKSFFIPKDADHVFIYADFSQVELRIAAHLSRDQALVDAYTLGIDLHRQTASKVFEVEPAQVTDLQRQVGKTINFLLIYDGSANRLLQELKEKNGLDFGPDDCQGFRENFFDFYKGYKAYLDKQKAFMSRYRLVHSEAGRLRRLPELVYGDFLNAKAKRFTGPPDLVAKLKESPTENLRDPEEIYWRARRKHSHSVKMGLNFSVQSLGASITKRAMVALRKASYEIVSTVHDSVIVQVHKNQVREALPKIQYILENTYTLSVPLKAEMKVLNSFDEKDTYEPDRPQKNLPVADAFASKSACIG